jgi:hypothetical protein
MFDLHLLYIGDATNDSDDCDDSDDSDDDNDLNKLKSNYDTLGLLPETSTINVYKCNIDNL